MTDSHAHQCDNSDQHHQAKPHDRLQGSPYRSSSCGASVMSCFLCGEHKPRNLGAMHKLLGRSVHICFACKPAKAPVVGN